MWTPGPYRRTRRGVGIRISIESDATPLMSHYSTCCVEFSTCTTSRPCKYHEAHSCPWLAVSDGGNDSLQIRVPSPSPLYDHVDHDRMDDDTTTASHQQPLATTYSKPVSKPRSRFKAAFVEFKHSLFDELQHCKIGSDLHCCSGTITETT